MNHEKKFGKWKNANSPAGHGLYAPAPDVVLDCPNCVTGIPKMGNEEWLGWKCFHCGAEFTLDELQTYNRLRR